MTGFGIASGIAIEGLEQNDTPWAGAFERVNAYALMAWIVVLAVTVMRHGVADLDELGEWVVGDLSRLERV